jgi:hypothetical protein
MRFPGVQLPLRLGDDATDIPAEARVTRVRRPPERILPASSPSAIRSGGSGSVVPVGTADRPDGPHRYVSKPEAWPPFCDTVIELLVPPSWCRIRC